MLYIEFKNLLYSYIEEDYQKFSSKLGDTIIPLKGIRIPILKKLVNQVYKTNLDLNEFEVNDSVEMQLLYFMIYLKRNQNYLDQFDFVLKNIHYMCCWQITDLVSSYMKLAPFDYYYKLFKENIKDSNVFTIRFFIVYGLKYTKANNSLLLLDLLKNLSDDYYIMMAKAWFLATLAINYSEDVYDFLNSSSLVLKRKTISKIVESFRISDEVKSKFKELRLNLNSKN